LPKIEDYALLSDLHTAALVSTAGSIDWLCLPRFDSPAAFAALLGNDDAGHWTLAPAAGGTCTTRRYAGNTLVLETDWVTAEGAVRVIDFMPPRADTPHVVRIAVGLDGAVAMRSALRLRFDYGREVPWVRQVGREVHAVAGPNLVRLAAAVPLRGEQWATLADFTVRPGDRVPFVLSWAPSHQPEMPYLDAEQALTATADFWTEWCSHAAYREGAYNEAIDRSIITLKGLTYAPTGGIVAAATTSLPEELGGVRNWDYRYCWLRDATYALQALLAAGFRREAGAWRDSLAGLALEQARRGVQQEPQERPFGLGQIERALQGTSRGGLVAERVPGDRVQKERLNQPRPPAHPGRAVQNRRERHGRPVRIVLGEPQHRSGDAQLAAVAVAFADAGEGLLGPVDLAEADQGVHQPDPQWPGQRMRPGQPLSGPERGQRFGRPAAPELELAANVVTSHRRRGVGFGFEGLLGVLDPGFRLVQPSLPRQCGSKRHGGEAGEQIVGPAVPLGQVDRLPAEFRRPRKPPVELDLGPVRQAHELEVWPSDPARQRDRLLEMRLGLVEPTCPGLGVADVDQRQRAQLFSAPHPPPRSLFNGAPQWLRHPGGLGRRQ
jgi:hypothetical protein